MLSVTCKDGDIVRIGPAMVQVRREGPSRTRLIIDGGGPADCPVMRGDLVDRVLEGKGWYRVGDLYQRRDEGAGVTAREAFIMEGLL